jgi:osmotically-inducible protein OsmY
MSELERKVRAGLEHDLEVDLHRNEIRLFQDDDVLCLEGEVDTIVIKRKAVQIAKRIAGHTAVDDRLKLRLGQVRADDELQQAVLDVLMTEPVFMGFAIHPSIPRPVPQERDWISVEVNETRVRLQGECSSLSHRRLAEVITWWIPGVADVDNRIHVRPPECESDAELADAIRLVFDKDPSIDAQQISVSVHEGHVTLAGAVANDTKRRIAAYDCWYIPGVHAVDNRIEI